MDLERHLIDLFGPIALASASWDFDCTRYYEPEMGTGLTRRFLAFPPAPAGHLATWKIAAGRIEEFHRASHGRSVNLDPGCITLGGLFLASTKPRPQRLYLADGIYAELTLLYRKSGWLSLPWTFPDFLSGRYDAFLTECREWLKRGWLDQPAG